MSTLFFPDLPGFSYGAVRSPTWGGLLIQTAASGLEARMQQWSAPKWEWTLAFNYLRMYGSFAEFQTLIGFYNQTFGGLTSFFFRDEHDNSTHGEPIGVGTGSQTQFQLQRNLGGSIEPIYGVDIRGTAAYGAYQRPAAVTFQAYVSASPASATVNTDTGVVTFSSAPGLGATLTADFSYLFRCRFAEQRMDFTTLFRQCYDAQQVKLIQSRT